LGAGVLCRRFQLLLVSSNQPRMPLLLGITCGPPFVAALQPGYGITADLDGRILFLRILAMDAAGGLPTHHDLHDAGHQPALSVLDSYRADQANGCVGVGAEHTFPPPRSSRDQSAVHRPQSCGNTDHLGQVVWKFRARAGTLHLWTDQEPQYLSSVSDSVSRVDR